VIDLLRRNDRHLEWKVWMFCVAAILALGGIYLDERLLTGAAIVFLASAMLLRFLPGGGPVDDEEAEEDEDEDREGEGSSADEIDEAGAGM
jgi:hypothetical protein